MKPGQVIEPITVCIRVITKVYLIPQVQAARTGFHPEPHVLHHPLEGLWLTRGDT